MKTLKLTLLLALALLPASHAEEVRFFRISGPVASTITAFSANGILTWTNAPTNATFTVQTAQALLSQSNWVDYVQVPISNSVTTHRIYDLNPPSGMVLIPAGSFTMGDTLDGFELPLHTVYVSAFHMDKYAVTKALWDEVYQWATNHSYSFDHPGSSVGGVNYSKGQNHPVHMINWYDGVKWCNARSELEGKPPAYYTDAGLAVRYRSGQVSPYVNWSSGYRLPTEAEWEKAARGGASGLRFPWGNTISWSQANYFGDPSSEGGYPYDVNPTLGYTPPFNAGTSPVGYFPANRYGLSDMAGNVSVWCWDWYSSTYYSSSPGTDPRGPTPSPFGPERVLRGGTAGSQPIYCRTSYRASSLPTYWGADVGFRSVLPAGQ